MTQKRTCHFVLSEKPLTTIIQLRKAFVQRFRRFGKKRRIKRWEAFNKRNRHQARAITICRPNREREGRCTAFLDISARRCFPSAGCFVEGNFVRRCVRLRFVRLADQPFHSCAPGSRLVVGRALCTSASIASWCSTCRWYMPDYPPGLLSTGDKAGEEVTSWLRFSSCVDKVSSGYDDYAVTAWAIYARVWISADWFKWIALLYPTDEMKVQPTSVSKLIW